MIARNLGAQGGETFTKRQQGGKRVTRQNTEREKRQRRIKVVRKKTAKKIRPHASVR